MLKVTVELVPFGIEDHPRRREIATMKIGLQRVREGVGEYVSTLEVDERGPQPQQHIVRVFHRRAKGAASLIRHCLERHLEILPNSA